MSAGTILLLSSLALFELKHFACDFVLQTAYIVRHKGIYGHRAGIIHAGLHALGSVPAILLLTGAPDLIAGIVIAEFLIHYHVDWLKLFVDRRGNLDMSQNTYWMVFGADQLIHQFTYIGILTVLARAAHL